VHDRFYNPHAVQQLTNGNIVLMDDGAMRPNCTCEVDGCDAAKDRCFSRAIEYELDFVRMEVGGVGGVGGSSARSDLEKCVVVRACLVCDRVVVWSCDRVITVYGHDDDDGRASHNNSEPYGSSSSRCAPARRVDDDDYDDDDDVAMARCRWEVRVAWEFEAPRGVNVSPLGLSARNQSATRSATLNGEESGADALAGATAAGADDEGALSLSLASASSESESTVRHEPEGHASLESMEKTDYYLNDGGSVYTLPNGNYVVAYTYIDNVYGDSPWPNATRTFEVTIGDHR
jgi:hypothetical protein